MLLFSKTTPSNSIPDLIAPVHLTLNQQIQLLKLTDKLVKHNIAQCSTVLVTKDGHADSRAWKELRRKDNIRVYKERPRSKAMPTTPSLLLLGTVQGNLDDVMYAIVTPTEQAMKIKSNCTNDGVIDRKVLHEIVRPTVDDPFRHVSINWSLYADSEPHDYVCVEATGVTHTLHGERVGFHLSHSVAFSQLESFSESHGVERGNRSICSLYRETTAGEVQCYVRGFFDFRDGDNELLTNIALHAIANQWLSVSRQIEFSLIKKLVWFLKYNTRKLAVLPDRRETCCVCFTSFGFLERKFSCENCTRAVCTRCRVKKSLWSDKMELLEKKRAFCRICVQEISSTSARVLAQHELQKLQLQQNRSLKEASDEFLGLLRRRSPSWPTTNSTFFVLSM